VEKSNDKSLHTNMQKADGHLWQAMQPNTFVGASSSTQVLRFPFKGFFEFFVVEVQ
jgi:hypothetical protein